MASKHFSRTALALGGTEPKKSSKASSFTSGIKTANKSMTFGQAVEALKQGKKVSRRGWNGKGMYLWLLPECVVKKEWCRDERLIECMGEADEILCLGSTRMFTHDSTGRKAVLTGWLASQSDILSEDWYIVD